MAADNGKVVMLFDGDCPLCRREVAHYQRLDRQQRVEWIDINQCDDLLADFGMDYRAAMERLHVIDRDGRLVSGVRAFITLWQVLPFYHYLAGLVLGLRLESPLEWLYVRFSRWRLRGRCSDTSCSSDDG